MNRLTTLLVLGLAALAGCNDHGDPPSTEAGVGGDRSGCEDPGSHSIRLSDHSCVCEAGYEWCSDELDDFECCAVEDHAEAESDTGEPVEPELPCGAEQLEQIVCVPGPAAPDPTESIVWACNGERWVEVPSYSTFVCVAEGFPFAYGCADDQPTPSFLCGYGSGSSCDPVGFAGLCVDEDIIDSCVWGRRTIDRCSRLCAELEVFGAGYSSGACSQLDPEIPATCECE